MEITKPIIIVGTGRSGSTVFFKVFTRHPHVMWINRMTVLYPERPILTRWSVQATGLPVIGEQVRQRMLPWEAYEFWNRLAVGFGTPYRDLHADDLTEREKHKIRKAFAQFPTATRHRMLIKLTGWPRLSYLHTIFPDARFIHIMRDGRAVTNSFLHVPFWWGKRGPDNWRLGKLAPKHQATWEKHDESFSALAALYWVILMESYREAQPSIPSEQYMEIRYEDLCANPIDVFRSITDFCDLEWTPEFESGISQSGLESRNDRWQKDLTEKQQHIISDVLAEELERYGYV